MKRCQSSMIVSYLWGDVDLAGSAAVVVAVVVGVVVGVVVVCLVMGLGLMGRARVVPEG